MGIMKRQVDTKQDDLLQSNNELKQNSEKEKLNLKSLVNEKDIIKIQAVFRGYIFRKNNKFNYIKQSVNKPKMSHRGRDKFPGGQTL